MHFLSYNNTVPIAVSVVLMGAGGAFAATNPEAIYNTEQSVVSVDNTYIANKNLETYTPRLEILGVTEDADNYYVSYRLSTIDIVDAVWQDVVKNDILTVAKAVLGEYGDLGLYATEQFNQIVDRQAAYLKEVQEIERKQVSQKMVATAYSGLVGHFLDSSTETLPGYTPVVEPPPPPIVEETPAPQEPEPQEENPPIEGEVPNPTPTIGLAPEIQILGENPMRLAIGTAFADLGVVVTDDSGDIPTLKKYLDGALVEGVVVIDTTVAKIFIITYQATDGDGNTTTKARTVEVYDPAAVIEPETVETATTTPPIEVTPSEAAPVETATEPVPEPAPEAAPTEPVAEPAAEPVPEVTASDTEL